MVRWDYELAAALNALGSQGKPETGPLLLEGTIVNTAPLTVSFCDGEVMAPPLKLDAVVCAQGLYRRKEDKHLYLEQWASGDRVVCCLLGETVVILGKLGGVDWDIPVR